MFLRTIRLTSIRSPCVPGWSVVRGSRSCGVDYDSFIILLNCLRVIFMFQTYPPLGVSILCAVLGPWVRDQLEVRLPEQTRATT